jgi:predicted DNA binding CopG/RHH family protein
MKKKNMPNFEDEAQEREFWQSHDSTDYIDWDSAERVILPKLKPSLKTISLRLPENLLNELKLLANKKDVPYQSLLKMFLAERVQSELENLVHNSLKNKEKIAQ